MLVLNGYTINIKNINESKRYLFHFIINFSIIIFIYLNFYFKFIDLFLFIYLLHFLCIILIISISFQSFFNINLYVFFIYFFVRLIS